MWPMKLLKHLLPAFLIIGQKAKPYRGSVNEIIHEVVVVPEFMARNVSRE